MPPPVRRKTLVLVCVALLGLVLAGVALADDPAGLSPRGPDSPQASRIEDIYWLLVAITGAIFVLVEGALILFVVRFRNRGRPRTLEGPQIHGATRLELIWTAIPVVILAVIVAFVLYKLPGINNVSSAEAKSGEFRVKVEGHQFYWNFVYPNGVVQVQTLRLPAQRAIKLDIHSLDVDHSWWIPSLDGKFDAIPGKVNHQRFFASRVGTFIGRCGEFCGYEHPKMVATVKTVPAADFDSWYASESRAQQNGTSNLGKMTFGGVCATCHGLQGEGGYGPALQGNPVLDQPDAIRTLLLNGRGKMPAVGRGWSNRQMEALIAYLKKLPSGGGGSSGG
jgi:cytochrome c oxidase subunit 2